LFSEKKKKQKQKKTRQRERWCSRFVFCTSLWPASKFSLWLTLRWREDDPKGKDCTHWAQAYDKNAACVMTGDKTPSSGPLVVTASLFWVFTKASTHPLSLLLK
jgi:hypothetical protein